MIRSVGRSLGSVALLSLGVWGCSSASAADGGQSPTGHVPAAAPPPHEAPLPDHSASPPPASSAEGIGSAALEHRLDKLEKDLASSPR
jgi:hypothetical protein